MRAGWCLIGALLGASASAAPRREPVPAAQLDEPGHALDHFRAALAAQRAGTATRPLRISWLGDSLTADDHLTHALRTQLAAVIGDGGPGFVFAAPPHPYCQHRAVTRIAGGSWRVHGISTAVPGDHLLGLGGSAESDGDGLIRFTGMAPVRSIDVHYLQQPHGGTFTVVADGKVLGELPTRSDQKHAEFARVELPEGTRKIELRAAGRVRLFGAALEAPRGAVVDNLGVVNATAKQLDHNNLVEHWRNQLAHRDADLVIVMLGTNEAEWLRARGAGMAEHEQVFGELLASIRAASPAGSCLVISPLDQLDWREEGLPPRDSVPAMVDAQHRAATAHGCAFWDVYQWMGGKGSSRQWFKRGLVVKDYQHPTSEGSARIAEALYAGLVH